MGATLPVLRLTRRSLLDQQGTQPIATEVLLARRKPIGFQHVGDEIEVRVRVEAKGRGSEIELEMTGYHVWEFDEEGRPNRLIATFDANRARTRAGL